MTQIDLSSQLGRREHEVFIREEPIEEEPIEISSQLVRGEHQFNSLCQAHEIFLKEEPISTTYDAVIIDIDRLIKSLLKNTPQTNMRVYYHKP